jgi:hypothetical protein
MRTMKTVVVAMMFVGGAAFGQGAAPDKKPEAAKPEAGAAKPAAPPAPKPAAELDQLKMMVGTWHCDGKGNMNGTDMPMKSTYRVAKDLDGFWLVGKLEGAKSKEMPFAYKSVDYYNYDAGSKQFVMASFDNTGSWYNATSKGWDGDKMTWTGKARMMGMDLDTTLSITKKGDKEVALSGSTTGQNYKDSMEITCKK